jgi:8-oxo-dGTP pyrophosphatase MutT (NUDIX family)
MTNDDTKLPRGPLDSAEVRAVPAATILLCRDEPFQLLMMRRHAQSSFVPDAWVFPGGALDDDDVKAAQQIGGDDVELTALRVCAIRELLEECGLWLGESAGDVGALREALRSGGTSMLEHVAALKPAIDRLVLTSRWITPVGVPKRFDTWFFIAHYEGDDEVTADQAEAVETRWISPAEALRLHREGSFDMVFPTIKNLEAIAEYSRTEDLMEARRGAEITPVQPLLVTDGKRKKIVLPEPA